MEINDIIKEFLVKDYTHFDDFYHLTKKQVFFAIVSIVKNQDQAEDLMQDTYVKFIEKIDQYHIGKNPYVYLSTIARNLAINYYNKEKRVIKNDEVIDLIPSEHEVEENEIDIEWILGHLDDQEREVVTLHVINDLKFREIADMLDKPIGTVLWIYNKAIKKLKEKVGDVL